MKKTNAFNPLDTFDHVVVLMLENRSFDNLLGNLYSEKELNGRPYAGLQDQTIEMPVPPRVKDYDQHKFVKPHTAKDYHQPFPDPGEVYQHVNTQLYNEINPKPKNLTRACDMDKPYNVPNHPPKVPPMTGFINDYVNTLQAIDCKECKPGESNPQCEACKGYKNPGYEQYNVIMQTYSHDQVSILSKLAKEFAVFDHWYSSVPSQTWCNRAFWHAGTSGGKVVNPTDECGILHKIAAMAGWIKDVWTQDTIFKRLKHKNISHAVFTSGPVSITGLVHGPFQDANIILSGEELTAFKNAISGDNFPQYSFIEPKFLGEHNDQHPSSAGAAGPLKDDGPTRVGSVLLGEHLIWDVYNTIQKSKYANKTLFIITHDEHGGCFDHVPPPPADGTRVYPPKPNMIGQKDFDFKRLGVRVPMVMVSAHIQPGTIINDVHDHTSFIKTMCNKWHLEGLTDRDKHANSFEGVFSAVPRELPPIDPPKVTKLGDGAFDDDPLNDLQKSLVVTAHYIATENKEKTAARVSIPSPEDIKTVKQANEFLTNLKPLLRGMC